MRASYSNNLFQSVYLWSEYVFAQTLQAYTVQTQKLYFTPDTSLPTGFISYNFPQKSIIYDSGVSGAYVMNSVSGGAFSTYPLTRASGIHIDYTNARVIVPSSFGTNLTLTGTASFRQVNLYAPQETEEQLLTQNKYFLNPRYGKPLNSGLQPYLYSTPAVFLNNLSMANEPFQFGGLINSKDTMSFTVLAETNFQLTAILSVLRDARYQNIAMLNLVDDPLDQWQDFKGGGTTGYNYVTLARTFGQPGNLIYVENVRTSKVSDNTKLNPRLFAGIVDMDLSYVRQAPITSNVFV